MLEEIAIDMMLSRPFCRDLEANITASEVLPEPESVLQDCQLAILLIVQKIADITHTSLPIGRREAASNRVAKGHRAGVVVGGGYHRSDGTNSFKIRRSYRTTPRA